MTSAIPSDPSEKSFDFKPSKVICGIATYNKYSDYEIKMANNTDSVINLNWILIQNTLSKGWDASICNYGQCLVGIPNKGKMRPIKKGENGFINLHVNPYEFDGNGVVKFFVFESGNEKNGDTITYNIKSNPI